MRIGLIAGGGQFPILFSKAASAKGYRVYAVAFIKETDRLLSEYVESVEWIHLGQLKRLLKFFSRNHVQEAVMLGSINKTRIFTDVKPDLKVISIIAGMRNTHDNDLLTTVADILEKEGVSIRSSTFLLPELVAPEGCWTKRKPDKSETADIRLGWQMAKAIGQLDIGQCVVLKGGSVLAVEAIDGTDATISRGGMLGKGGAVVVKVCKPMQDKRFDMPSVGALTIKTMARYQLSTLAIEAGNAVVFDKDEMIDIANRNGISIVALREPQIET